MQIFDLFFWVNTHWKRSQRISRATVKKFSTLKYTDDEGLKSTLATSSDSVRTSLFLGILVLMNLSLREIKKDDGSPKSFSETTL